MYRPTKFEPGDYGKYIMVKLDDEIGATVWEAFKRDLTDGELKEQVAAKCRELSAGIEQMQTQCDRFNATLEEPTP